MNLAIITGGSRGLGGALCDEYLRRGWQVVEFSRTAPFSFSVKVDMSDPLNSAEVFANTLDPLAEKRISEVVAVGNAAVLGPVGPTARAIPADVAGHLNTNIVSGILFARAVVSAFQKHVCPKTFVNISSGAAVNGYAGWSLYCASKASIENFVRSLSLEQAAHSNPIHAISVNPGVMDTAMQAVARGARIEDFPSVERFIRLHQEGMLVQPSVVARRIADLVDSRPETGGVYALHP